MAMEQFGYVMDITDTEVKIRVMRESACGGNCTGCHGCPSGVVEITCPIDPEHLVKIGDKVTLEMPAVFFFKNAFWSYGIMTIFFLCGAILGYFISRKESGSIIGAFVGLVVAVLIMRKINSLNNSKIKIKHK